MNRREAIAVAAAAAIVILTSPSLSSTVVGPRRRVKDAEVFDIASQALKMTGYAPYDEPGMRSFVRGYVTERLRLLFERYPGYRWHVELHPSFDGHVIVAVYIDEGDEHLRCLSVQCRGSGADYIDSMAFRVSSSYPHRSLSL